MMKKHRLISILALLLAMQFLLMPMQAMAQGTGGSGEGAQENSAPTPDTVPQGTEPTPGDPTEAKRLPAPLIQGIPRTQAAPWSRAAPRKGRPPLPPRRILCPALPPA